jgi:hypothetical protein
MAKRAFRVAGIAAAVLGLAAALACGSSKSGSTAAVDSGTPCNENPWECPSGQVCWPTTSSPFACLTSGTAQAGEACMLTVGAATCSDGLNCLAISDSGAGVCSPYCDPTDTDAGHGCAATAVCRTAYLPGSGSATNFNVCVPSEQGGTSGVASDASADVVVE